MNTNYETKLFALLGHPVSNSFSPIMHSYLFEKYDINGSYLCFDIKPEDIEDVIKTIKNLNICGFNVTIPYKTKVIDLLDEVDKNAYLIGAVNTVKNENGKLKGYNTDGKGFVKSIEDGGYQIKDKSVIILGCGGACRSIAIELAAKGVKKIDIRNRSLENAKEIKNRISDNFDTEVVFSKDEIIEKDIKKYDFLINTTPIGMESEECPINESMNISSNIVICDIVYKPHMTNLMKWAEKNNLKTIYGIDMLINQGINAFEIWTNKKVDLKDTEILKEMFQNNKI